MAEIVSRRARLRLPRDCYTDNFRAYSVTIAVRDRAPVFSRAEVADAFVAQLVDFASRVDVRIWAFCVMPDHVHIVMTPSATCDVVKFIGNLKSLSLRAAWAVGVTGTFWQPRFWDRVVRNQDGLQRAILYVLENPERAGLVGDWRDYRWTGGEWLAEMDDRSGVQAPALHS